MRYFYQNILEDLKEKMVFIGGPQQVGKTTLSLFCLGKEATEKHPGYFNWDAIENRKELLQGQLPKKQKLIVLDEIHKYPKWRNLVKGFYDTEKSDKKFLITGSARLDYYRKGGDSLQGRYHYYRLHPFSLSEICNHLQSKSDLEHLLRFGGFPEPLIRGNVRHWKRWQKERLERVIYEDLRDLEMVKEVSLIEELTYALPSKVGSPLSIKSLKEDLQVAHETVERFVSILERLYFCFRIMPYGAPRIRAVKKEKKIYLWDWSLIENHGPKFENLVACQLLKYCHFLEDTEGDRMELRFIRDTDKREVDFVVIKDKKPLFAVECKTGEKQISPSLKYFRERIDIPKFYQVHLGKKDYGNENRSVRVLPFSTFCSELNLP